MNKHCISLELDKILKMLSDTASSADAKQIALEINPRTDYFEVLEKVVCEIENCSREEVWQQIY